MSTDQKRRGKKKTLNQVKGERKKIFAQSEHTTNETQRYDLKPSAAILKGWMKRKKQKKKDCRLPKTEKRGGSSQKKKYSDNSNRIVAKENQGCQQRKEMDQQDIFSETKKLPGFIVYVKKKGETKVKTWGGYKKRF